VRGADSALGIMFVVTDAGGFTAFCARYPQLCVGASRLDAGVSDDVTTGAPARGEPLATPSDNALVGHFNDQVTTLSPLLLDVQPKTPFTRYSRLSEGLYNRFDTRL